MSIDIHKQGHHHLFVDGCWSVHGIMPHDNVKYAVHDITSQQEYKASKTRHKQYARQSFHLTFIINTITNLCISGTQIIWLRPNVRLHLRLLLDTNAK